MMHVLTPRGVLRKVLKVNPICETRIEFNGSNRKFIEAAKDMAFKPTGVGLVFESHSDRLCMSYENELFIGNLKPEKVKEIQQKLLTEGYYDFSSMDYQKAKIFDKTVFDGGSTSPYTSDFTFGIMPLEVMGIHVMRPSDIFSSPCVGVIEADFGNGCNEREVEDEQE